MVLNYYIYKLLSCLITTDQFCFLTNLKRYFGMSQYSFLDCNYFNKDELNKKDIYSKVTECDLEDVSKHAQNYILDPNISIVKIKDIEKGS